MIKNEVSRQIFRNLMRELFTRLESTRKKVIVKRQLSLLEKLLNTDGKIEFSDLANSLKDDYKSRKAPINAIIRDLTRLGALGAVWIEETKSSPKANPMYYISVRLDWPSRITEAEFFAKIAAMPKSKTYGFLSPS